MISYEKMRQSLFLSSLVLFLVSLTQKTFCTHNGCSDALGNLFFGFIVLFDGGGISWLANPLLIVSWVGLSINSRYTLLTSVAAFLLSLSFLFVRQILVNEGGAHSTIIEYKLGYWLWVSSTAIMVLAGVLIMFNQKK